MHAILALGSPRQEDCQFGGQAELLSEYELHRKIPSERTRHTERVRGVLGRREAGRQVCWVTVLRVLFKLFFLLSFLQLLSSSD